MSGFEIAVDGKLLTRVVDFSRAMGVAYERSIGYDKPPHTHDRLTITFPRGGNRTSMHLCEKNATQVLDSGCVHVMPAEVLHSQKNLSAVYDTFALFPTPEILSLGFARLRISESQQDLFLGQTRRLPKSALLNDLAERCFAIAVLGRPSSE